jgi:hypothetical protein
VWLNRGRSGYASAEGVAGNGGRGSGLWKPIFAPAATRPVVIAWGEGCGTWSRCVFAALGGLRIVVVMHGALGGGAGQHAARCARDSAERPGDGTDGGAHDPTDARRRAGVGMARLGRIDVLSIHRMLGHDFFFRCDFVSPCSRRVLFTVRAARSSASSFDTPRSWYESLMCSYWRPRLDPSLTPRGMTGTAQDARQKAGGTARAAHGGQR